MLNHGLYLTGSLGTACPLTFELDVKNLENRAEEKNPQLQGFHIPPHPHNSCLGNHYHHHDDDCYDDDDGDLNYRECSLV